MRKELDKEPLKERPTAALNEMAVVCKKSDGFGIIIEIYSEDHGVLGSKENPAHAHVRSASGEYLGKFAITIQPPRSAEYVFDVDKKKRIPTTIKSIIVKWGKTRNKDDIIGWSLLRSVWRALHP